MPCPRRKQVAPYGTLEPCRRSFQAFSGLACFVWFRLKTVLLPKLSPKARSVAPLRPLSLLSGFSLFLLPAFRWRGVTLVSRFRARCARGVCARRAPLPRLSCGIGRQRLCCYLGIFAFIKAFFSASPLRPWRPGAFVPSPPSRSALSYECASFWSSLRGGNFSFSLVSLG